MIIAVAVISNNSHAQLTSFSFGHLAACWPYHYNDDIMGAMASQVTSLTVVYSTIYWGADQRKHQSSASLAFVRGIHRWPVNFPHKWPVTRKMFPFDDVIMMVINMTMPVLTVYQSIPCRCFLAPLVTYRSLSDAEPSVVHPSIIYFSNRIACLTFYPIFLIFAFKGHNNIPPKRVELENFDSSLLILMG